MTWPEAFAAVGITLIAVAGFCFLMWLIVTRA